MHAVYLRRLLLQPSVSVLPPADKQCLSLQKRRRRWGAYCAPSQFRSGAVSNHLPYEHMRPSCSQDWPHNERKGVKLLAVDERDDCHDRPPSRTQTRHYYDNSMNSIHSKHPVRNCCFFFCSCLRRSCLTADDSPRCPKRSCRSLPCPGACFIIIVANPYYFRRPLL